MGFKTNRTEQVIAEGNTGTMESILSTLPSKRNDANARQSFQLLKQNTGETTIVTPPKCMTDAPAEINVFTDGSWLYPLKQFIGLGGAGVWWPNRTLTRNEQGVQPRPISFAEGEIAIHIVEDGGIRLYTKIGGYAGSSTRTELAAGIIAVCANGPVHIGSDSEVFVNAANLMINKLTTNPSTPYNFKLMSDGDLWEHFHRAVLAKGPKAVKLTWVKGHATQEHVDLNITTNLNKKGNHEADATADLGTALHGESVMLVAKHLHNRHRQYQGLMKDVSQHLVEAYLVHRLLTEQCEQKTLQLQTQLDKKKVTYNPLLYPNLEQTTHLNNNATIHDFKQFKSKNNCAEHLESFLANLRVSEANASMRGITWYELYILYRIRGAPKPLADPEQKAGNKPTAHKQINAFQKQLRGVVKRTLAPSDAAMFKPFKLNHDALAGLALKGNHASVNCNITVNQHEKDTIASAIINLSRNITKQHCQEFLHNTRSITPIDLKLNGKADWDSTLTKFKAKDAADHCETTLRTWNSVHNPPAMQEYSYFQCPRCSHVEYSSCKSFQFSDLEHKQKCNACEATTQVKDWKCECEIPWHRCGHHRFSTNDHITKSMKRETNRQTSATSSVPKKGRPNNASDPLSFEELLKQDVQTAKRNRDDEEDLTLEPLIVLGKPTIKSIKVSSLGAILKKRFIHPGGE